ncbi:hypothetical protein [Tenggerimyces flavus]|uniref:Uncharacterized protein n=1 Tax=Tenggerimyces flavus TaxID=1708749 RepID=A0ABV7Y576_9ACTN|nr:hypothetical protein [Tenggerimyces flavus]MBM7788584.1 hypothetical protein [Tenggerimyces flavus]
MITEARRALGWGRLWMKGTFIQTYWMKVPFIQRREVGRRDTRPQPPRDRRLGIRHWKLITGRNPARAP